MLSRLMTNTSIGFKSVQKSSQNILLNLLQNHFELNSVKQLVDPFQMYGRWYRTSKYIIGLDLEKVSGAGFTGMSTKAGDLLTLNFRDCEVPGLGGSVPSRVFCALNYDCVLNIKDYGVEIAGLIDH